MRGPGVRALSTVLAVACLVGCAGPRPPSRWGMGGARLDLPAARWSYDGDDVEIRPRGADYAEVVVDGDVELHLDRVGRVYDRYKRPIAVLEADGRLVGTDDELLGVVGALHAALPGQAHAWLSVDLRGVVVRYDEYGQASAVGAWLGCGASPYTAQTCVLVSYLLYFEDEGVRTGERAGVGVGATVVMPVYAP